MLVNTSQQSYGHGPLDLKNTGFSSSGLVGTSLLKPSEVWSKGGNETKADPGCQMTEISTCFLWFLVSCDDLQG